MQARQIGFRLDKRVVCAILLLMVIRQLAASQNESLSPSLVQSNQAPSSEYDEHSQSSDGGIDKQLLQEIIADVKFRNQQLRNASMEVTVDSGLTSMLRREYYAIDDAFQSLTYYNPPTEEKQIVRLYSESNGDTFVLEQYVGQRQCILAGRGPVVEEMISTHHLAKDRWLMMPGKYIPFFEVVPLLARESGRIVSVQENGQSAVAVIDTPPFADHITRTQARIEFSKNRPHIMTSCTLEWTAESGSRKVDGETIVHVQYSNKAKKSDGVSSPAIPEIITWVENTTLNQEKFTSNHTYKVDDFTLGKVDSDRFNLAFFGFESATIEYSESWGIKEIAIGANIAIIIFCCACWFWMSRRGRKKGH